MNQRRSNCLRSEMTMLQLWQRNIRLAGYRPAARRSAKCLICAPQPLHTRVGASSLSVAEPGIGEQWQMSRIAAEQFGTLPEINCGPGSSPAAVASAVPRFRQGPGRRLPGDRAGGLLRRRQLASKPRVCSWRFHRVDQFGLIRAGVMASGALQHGDFETRGAGGNPHRRRGGLARWTYWRGVDEHGWTP